MGTTKFAYRSDIFHNVLLLIRLNLQMLGMWTLEMRTSGRRETSLASSRQEATPVERKQGIVSLETTLLVLTLLKEICMMKDALRVC
jgi:hypothetical protein